MAGTRARGVEPPGARVLALLVVSLLAVLRSTLLVVTVTGSSMAPAYAAGDRVLVRRTRRPRRGQVVVFRRDALASGAPRRRIGPPRGLVIKRLVAVAGDPVPPDVLRAAGAAPGDLVPAGHVVVRGDGTSSVDSRHWGFLPVTGLVGQVVADLAHGSAERDEGYNHPRSLAR